MTHLHHVRALQLMFDCALYFTACATDLLFEFAKTHMHAQDVLVRYYLLRHNDALFPHIRVMTCMHTFCAVCLILAFIQQRFVIDLPFVSACMRA